MGIIRIHSVAREATRDIPDSDWDAEGFAYMEQRGLLIGAELSCRELWDSWRNDPDLSTWVIRFELVEVYADA